MTTTIISLKIFSITKNNMLVGINRRVWTPNKVINRINTRSDMKCSLKIQQRKKHLIKKETILHKIAAFHKTSQLILLFDHLLPGVNIFLSFYVTTSHLQDKNIFN